MIWGGKRGQVTIFIILGLLFIVILAILFLLFRGVEPTINTADEENPQQYIDSCVGDAVEEAVEILMRQGGYLEPTNFKLYGNEKLPYLCYTRNYYEKCINQEPMLIEHLEKEITFYIKPKIEGCFVGLKTGLEKKSYEVTMGDLELDTDMTTGRIFVDVNNSFKMVKGGRIDEFEKFEVEVSHPLYDLAIVALEVVNQEAQFCNFEYLGYMIFYPDYDIRKFTTGDDVKIYTLRDLQSGKEFKFAIRSCAPRHGL